MLQSQLISQSSENPTQANMLVGLNAKLGLQANKIAKLKDKNEKLKEKLGIHVNEDELISIENQFIEKISLIGIKSIWDLVKTPSEKIGKQDFSKIGDKLGI